MSSVTTCEKAAAQMRLTYRVATSGASAGYRVYQRQLARHWATRGWDTAGIDISQDYVAAARDAGVDARFCDLNRDSLPFGDTEFDLIFAGEVIEHLWTQMAFWLRCAAAANAAVILLYDPESRFFENRSACC